jgi:hypothetical protein
MKITTIGCAIGAPRSPLVDKALKLLERSFLERNGIRLKPGSRDPALTLDIQSGLGTEGFRIEDAPNGTVRLVGNDERGLLYAVGKHLRLPHWRGTSVPDKPVRGIYFATHFHNFYHDAPVAEVQRYIEELALWGCNALQVWFDMHHYTGIDDPDAQTMIRRLTALMQTAQGVGMSLALVGIANESFSSSPQNLRADWTAGHDGYHHPPNAHYHMEICPSRPGGLDLILQYRRQMLESFRGLNVEYYGLWPYDQGGCTCSHCAPWGVNGFLRCAEAVATLAREVFPGVKTVLSTWYFDHFVDGEWAGLAHWFATRKPDWVDYLLADDYGRFPDYIRQHGVPGNQPLLNFPEISMQRMMPWGGFGANPRLAHWQSYWDGAGTRLAGGFPYSEGIFEDINKVVQLQLCWDGRRTTRDIALEYAAGEFAPKYADQIVDAMLAMEANLDHGVDCNAVYTALSQGSGDLLNKNPPRIYTLPSIAQPVHYAKVLRVIDGKLAPAARRAWRWRILWLRAALDAEVRRSAGRPTPVTEACFEELTAIYHAAGTDWIVSPPSLKALTRLKHEISPGMGVPPTPVVKPTQWHSKYISTWRISRLVAKTVAAVPPAHLSDPLDWERIQAEGHSPDFVNVHNRTGNADGIVYLANKFLVRKAGRWILHVGHDGGIRVFVNGRVRLTVPDRINPAPMLRSQVTLKLGKGLHEIVIALDTAQGNGWGLFCCFEIPKPARRPGALPQFPRRVGGGRAA